MTYTHGDYGQTYSERSQWVIAKEPYNAPGFVDKPRIVDIGSGVGTFGIYVHNGKRAHWTDPVYTGYEADGELASMGQKNMQILGDKEHFRIIPLAVVPKPSKKKAFTEAVTYFKRDKSNPHNSSLVAVKEDNIETKTVPIITIDRIEDCDILKISTPGVEYPLLHGYMESRANDKTPRYILINYTSEKSRNCIDNLLLKKGYAMHETLRIGCGKGIVKYILTNSHVDIFRDQHDQQGYHEEDDKLFDKGMALL